MISTHSIYYFIKSKIQIEKIVNRKPAQFTQNLQKVGDLNIEEEYTSLFFFNRLAL